MSKEAPIILPPKYYLDNFWHLIGFVEEHSGHLLSPEDQAFIREVRSLQEEAQCILVRMLNRKGAYFRLGKFSYVEINNIEQAVQNLVDEGLATLDPHPDYDLLRLFTKSELIALFPALDSMQKKDELLNTLLAEHPIGLTEAITQKHTVCQVLVQESFEYLKFLYFGHTHGMMTEFVVRDLGNIALESLEEKSFTAWFDSLAEAKSAYTLHHWNEWVKAAQSTCTIGEYLETVSGEAWGALLSFPKCRKIGDKLMHRIGEHLEKNGYPTDALGFYELSRKHPARERRIRILRKLGRTTEAKELAGVALGHPYNPSERIFCEDFLGQTESRTYRSTTHRIKQAQELLLPEPDGLKVEQLVLDHLYEKGYEGLHVENYLWRSLFGLIFWEEVYNSEKAVYHHPLQRMPDDASGLGTSFLSFDELSACLSKLRNRKQVMKRIEETYSAKEGIASPYVGWHPNVLVTIEACITRVPLKAIKSVLLEMSKNIKDHGKGFPDLFVWRGKEYHFYEVKSPNDHLSEQQLYWLDFFHKNRIKSEILRIKYAKTA